MTRQSPAPSRGRLNRRSFLRGAAGVSVALPFLESLPQRSAWAADEAPTFSLFLCAAGGVVPESFFPDAHGPLTTEGLASAGKATSQLARHAERLLFVSGVDYPPSHSDVHREGLIMCLTGRAATGAAGGGTCGGPRPCLLAAERSADWEVCERTTPGTEPLVLYYGSRGYTNEMLSWSAAGTVAPAIVNPYELYQRLVGLVGSNGAPLPGGDRASEALLASRNSVHDLVREELQALMTHPRLSAADRDRLQQHFDSIRDAEVSFGGMANEAVERCSAAGLNVSLLQSLQDFKYDNRRTEEIVQLQLSLVALAFACNYTRSASLQWGDAYDHSVYEVPSNAREWNLTYISHRMPSDSASGDDDPLAAQAHAEIDALRMSTLASGLDHFEARGLGDQCLVMWSNQFTNGPWHATKSVPHVIWGSPGGHLKQGAYVDAGGSKNNRLLNAVLSAAIHDTGKSVDDFGEGQGGQLEVVLAAASE